MFESVNRRESTIDLVPLTNPTFPFFMARWDRVAADILHSSDFVKAIIGLWALTLFKVAFIISGDEPLCKHNIEQIFLSPCLFSKSSITLFPASIFPAKSTTILALSFNNNI